MLGSSFQKIYLKHTRAQNRHKSEYDEDDDGFVTLYLNIKFHVSIFYYILNIVISLLNYRCKLVW